MPTKTFCGWVTQRRPRKPRRFIAAQSGLHFAFYGRMSTVDYQDRASSLRWQYNYASDLIAGHGRIVAEFFDEGVSRRVAWPDRPQASALLQAIRDPQRCFDAIVVGEYERAFQGQQLAQLAPILKANGVQLWLPETYGPVDFHDPRQLAVLDLLGIHSYREVARARYRTTAAMGAQAELQGRHLGGRPPYGYMLVDAGPHPNRVHAAWGRRLHRLEPDPATAEHVRWIFAQRLAGRSVAAIARMLNDLGVPCPSSVDRQRNPHRSGESWMATTVAAILANPRYTGRQVWNRQPSHHDPVESEAGISRTHEVPRRTAATWVISDKPAHPPLIGESDFIAVQAIHVAPAPDGGERRRYLLASLVCCGICGRIMDSHWAHHRASYRCRHGYNSARTKPAARPPILYVREDRLLAAIHSSCSLRQQHPELRTVEPEALAAYLHAHSMIIVCDHGTWAVETDAATIPLTEPPNGPQNARIPAQRSGDQAKREENSRSVWN